MCRSRDPGIYVKSATKNKVINVMRSLLASIIALHEVLIQHTGAPAQSHKAVSEIPARRKNCG